MLNRVMLLCSRFTLREIMMLVASNTIGDTIG